MNPRVLLCLSSSFAAVVLSACGREGINEVDRAQELVAAHAAARAVALALADSNVRFEVRDVWRASLFVDHKIELQQFLASEAGRHLVESAARALATTPSALHGTLRTLPRLDFYVPRSTDRRQWRGTADIVVGATLDNDRVPEVVYGPDGAASSYSNGTVGRVLILLEPAEVKDRRVHPQASVPMQVIQSPEDGEEGGAILSYDAHGRLVEEIQLADFVARMQRGQPRSNTASITTYLDTTFVDQFWTDATDGAGTMEIEFRANYYDANGTWVDARTLRKTGLYDSQTYHWHDVQLFQRITDTTTQKINVHIVETDAFFDDNMGNRDFFFGDNGQIRGISCCGAYSDVKLGWTKKYSGTNATGEPPPRVGIVGPSSVRPSATCVWDANVSGVSAFSYNWTKDGGYAGSDPDLTTSLSSTGTIYVQVTDATGQSTTGSLPVTVSPTAPICRF